MKLADISIKRPVFITVIIMSLTIVGILCYKNLTINDMPEADIPYVTVTISQRGATPEEIEAKVTKKVEESVGQISGVKHITSTMMSGVSNTVIEFGLDKPSEVAAQEVRDKLGSVRGQLPRDIDEPIIAKFDFSARAVVSLAITNNGDSRELSNIVDDIVKKRLNSVKGVGTVNTYGNDEREIEVKLDNDKLSAYGLTTAEVANSLRNDNIEMPAGKVRDKEKEISIKTDSTIDKVEDFNNILVGKKNNVEIRLKDVANITDGIKDKSSLSYYQGKNAIGIDVVKQSGANTVEVADGIKKELDSIKNSLPKDVKVEVVRDNSVNIRNTVDEVMKTIIEGCILAIIIVFLFLNEWESTLISATSLPISIISTFICMKLMKFSLNTMSLMALSLAVGLLIDDAIVVIENIVRHLHMGSSPLKAAKEATNEIGFAVIATTLAVISVFLPIALVSGIIGKYFIEFGLTVVFSMLVSLFISFTLVPMMSSRMLKESQQTERTIIGKFFRLFNQKFNVLSEKYSEFLGVVLNHRLITMILAVALFLGSTRLFPLLGFSFMPSTDQGEINISANLDSGLSLESAGKKTKQIEESVKKYSEVNYTYSTVKRDSVSIFVKLIDKKERKDSAKVMAEKMRNDLKDIPGVETSVSVPSSGGPGGSKDVSFNIVGDNYQELQNFALKAKQFMQKDPHAKDVSINYKAGSPETKIDVDRDKAADLGVNSSAIGDTLSTLFNGTVVGKFDNGKDRYDVRLSIDDNQGKNLNDLENIYVSGANNKMIPLNQVTKKVFSTTSSSIHRYDRTGQIEISANVSGMATGDFLNLYTKKLNTEMEMPKGVSLSVGGANSAMQEGFTSLIVALGMSVLFLYLVMAAQFESFIDPVAIMFALPLAIIGAIIGLYISGSQMSIMAMIGIIMLMGLVAKNGILLIDAAKQRINDGVEINESLKEAGLVRLRPIVMTSLAMIFGMIPLALAKGAGTEMRAPMAQAVIGGLITSTILTLFVVPVIYTVIDDIKRFFRNIRTKISPKQIIQNDKEDKLNEKEYK